MGRGEERWWWEGAGKKGEGRPHRERLERPTGGGEEGRGSETGGGQRRRGDETRVQGRRQ